MLTPDYYSPLSPRIISSEKMAMDLLRRPTDEELSPTDCSEDSVEIRSPRPTVFRPNAVLATCGIKRAGKHWTEEPEEKRMRHLVGPPHFYPPPPALKLAGHPLLHWMNADWMRTNWPPLHYYPHLLHLPPPPPIYFSPYGLPHPLYRPIPPTEPPIRPVTPPPPPEETPIIPADKKTTPVRIKKPKKATAFLSVETLLKPAEPEEEEEPEAHWAPAYRDQQHLPGNRNYKNMTRERRMQANARERTRVHTISAAFEALRRAVPSFSHGQRLSKLSILRVASAYIAALGQLAGDDAPADDNLTECVDRCTRTLMTEGQMPRRKRTTQQSTATDDEDD